MEGSNEQATRALQQRYTLVTNLSIGWIFDGQTITSMAQLKMNELRLSKYVCVFVGLRFVMLNAQLIICNA